MSRFKKLPKVVLHTIYRYPADYPGKYVLRPVILDLVTKERTRGKVFVADSLEGARSALPRGVVNFGRLKGDAPIIIETWI